MLAAEVNSQSSSNHALVMLRMICSSQCRYHPDHTREYSAAVRHKRLPATSHSLHLA